MLMIKQKKQFSFRLNAHTVNFKIKQTITHSLTNALSSASKLLAKFFPAVTGLALPPLLAAAKRSASAIQKEMRIREEKE